MIEVIVTYDEQDRIIEFYANGHANAGPYGHDLVCAAVSASITGCFNALDYIDEYEYCLKEGYAFLKISNPNHYHDEIVMSTLIIILKTIEQTASENIKISDNHIKENETN